MEVVGLFEVVTDHLMRMVKTTMWTILAVLDYLMEKMFYLHPFLVHLELENHLFPLTLLVHLPSDPAAAAAVLLIHLPIQVVDLAYCFDLGGVVANGLNAVVGEVLLMSDLGSEWVECDFDLLPSYAVDSGGMLLELELELELPVELERHKMIVKLDEVDWVDVEC